jgi:hypothetical protein
MIKGTTSSTPPPSTRIYRNSSSWQLLNYVVSEPGEWSVPLVAQDMGGGSRVKSTYETALFRLQKRGYVVTGEKTRKGFLLYPTKMGIEAFKHSQCLDKNSRR